MITAGLVSINAEGYKPRPHSYDPLATNRWRIDPDGINQGNVSKKPLPDYKASKPQLFRREPRSVKYDDIFTPKVDVSTLARDYPNLIKPVGTSSSFLIPGQPQFPTLAAPPVPGAQVPELPTFNAGAPEITDTRETSENVNQLHVEAVGSSLDDVRGVVKEALDAPLRDLQSTLERLPKSSNLVSQSQIDVLLDRINVLETQTVGQSEDVRREIGNLGSLVNNAVYTNQVTQQQLDVTNAALNEIQPVVNVDNTVVNNFSEQQLYTTEVTNVENVQNFDVTNITNVNQTLNQYFATFNQFDNRQVNQAIIVNGSRASIQPGEESTRSRRGSLLESPRISRRRIETVTPRLIEAAPGPVRPSLRIDTNVPKVGGPKARRKNVKRTGDSFIPQPRSQRGREPAATARPSLRIDTNVPQVRGPQVRRTNVERTGDSFIPQRRSRR
jgi:hypothetical protein